MTLDEAIKHCEEVAQEQDMKADFETDNQTYIMSEMERKRCRECAEEHWQLAAWLRELKSYKEGGWHPFRQEQDPETGLWKFVDPPADGQHILITVNVSGHDPVQEDYWYDDLYCHLDSGYMLRAEAIAWMAWPDPYVPSTDVGRMEVENEESHR